MRAIESSVILRHTSQAFSKLPIGSIFIAVSLLGALVVRPCAMLHRNKDERTLRSEDRLVKVILLQRNIRRNAGVAAFSVFRQCTRRLRRRAIARRNKSALLR